MLHKDIGKRELILCEIVANAENPRIRADYADDIVVLEDLQRNIRTLDLELQKYNRKIDKENTKVIIIDTLGKIYRIRIDKQLTELVYKFIHLGPMKNEEFKMSKTTIFSNKERCQKK